MGNDEPVIIWSQTDIREYASHMRAPEALPDNQDDVFENVPQDNLGQHNLDPFETVNDLSVSGFSSK